jgi:nucleoside-diphosphate-sugar epimerase
MRLLLTGASGFFGKSVIQALKQTKETIEVFYIYHLNSLTLDDARFHEIQCDLLHQEQVRKLMNEVKPDCMIHLAWHVPPHQFWSAPNNVDWLFSSIHLFKTFCENGGKQFIGAGTLAEYDQTGGKLDEQYTPLKPNTLYGQCKKSLHELLVALRNANQYKTNIIWPRIGFFFGPGEPSEKLIPKLIHHIKNDIPMDLADASWSRAYAHVRYLGDMFAKLVTTNQFLDLTFNASGSIQYRLDEIVSHLQKILGKSRENLNFGVYPSNPISLSVNTTILKEQVGLEIPDTFFRNLEQFTSRSIIDDKI